MKILDVKSLALPEVKIIRCGRFFDPRGFFTETFRKSDIEKVIPGFNVVQVNESHSKKGTIRGLHLQWNPYQGKLVRTVKGHMADIALDARINSPNFGKAVVYDMPISDSNEYFELIWVPVGFAHGNVYFEDSTIEYYCTGEYSPGNEAGINPLDKTIDWSVNNTELLTEIKKIMDNNPVLSEKDQAGFLLADWAKTKQSQFFV